MKEGASLYAGWVDITYHLPPSCIECKLTLHTRLAPAHPPARLPACPRLIVVGSRQSVVCKACVIDQ